jgi:hypothetical protein
MHDQQQCTSTSSFDIREFYNPICLIIVHEKQELNYFVHVCS